MRRDNNDQLGLFGQEAAVERLRAWRAPTQADISLPQLLSRKAAEDAPTGPDAAKPPHLGYRWEDVKSILNPTSGFTGAYDFTVNPYGGCAFGCAYCYAVKFAPTPEEREDWGFWVRIKQNAVAQLATELRKKPELFAAKSRLYMSTVTDPYQPAEAKLELTRKLLELFVEAVPQPRLTIQTRSPLVKRDIDLIGRLKVKRVNMTVTTDDEDVRKAYEPMCPGNNARLAAIAEVAAAGIPISVTMTPLLPVRDPEAFAERLLATGSRKFVVQPFHAPTGGNFGKGTREAALKINQELNWDKTGYARVVPVLLERLRAAGADVQEGQAGFAPE
jgi:DNA repair photolyase